MIRHLKIKFVCINMLIVAVMLTVIFGMVLHFTSRNMEFQNSQSLQKLHQMQFYKVPKEPAVRTPYFMAQISPRGTVTISASDFFSHITQEQLTEIAVMAHNSEHTKGVLKEYDLQYSRQMTPFGERLVFIDISRDRIIKQDLLKTCGAISFLSFSVFFVISVVLAHWAVKPVDHAWKQQRQFVADASHELKTPLTVILTNAELMQNPEYDGVSRNQFAQSIYTMSLQMRGLVESLLDLARLDSGAAKITFSELDFSSIISDSLLPFEPLCYEKEMDIADEIEAHLFIAGSETHIRQVLDILMDNALKYGQTPGTVGIALHKQGNSCVLSVSNPGEEISKDDLKNIFKRFYRADKVRTMSRSYGLGLSIAQSIIHEHGGKIWAESRNGINTFFVQLPLKQGR